MSGIGTLRGESEMNLNGITGSLKKETDALCCRSAHLQLWPCKNSIFSHAAGESGCAGITRCISVRYLLDRYKLTMEIHIQR